MKKLIRKIFVWAFRDYITGIGLDHHMNSKSWAVFSLGSENVDYVAFLQLNDEDIYYIRKILAPFSDKSINIDKNPFINKELFFREPKYWPRPRK